MYKTRVLLTNATQRAERQNIFDAAEGSIDILAGGGSQLQFSPREKAEFRMRSCSVLYFSGLKSFAVIKTGKINSKDANFINNDKPTENSGQIKGEHNKTYLRANGVRNANTVIMVGKTDLFNIKSRHLIDIFTPTR